MPERSEASLVLSYAYLPISLTPIWHYLLMLCSTHCANLFVMFFAPACSASYTSSSLFPLQHVRSGVVSSVLRVSFQFNTSNRVLVLLQDVYSRILRWACPSFCLGSFHLFRDRCPDVLCVWFPSRSDSYSFFAVQYTHWHCGPRIATNDSLAANFYFET